MPRYLFETFNFASYAILWSNQVGAFIKVFRTDRNSEIEFHLISKLQFIEIASKFFTRGRLVLISVGLHQIISQLPHPSPGLKF